MRATIFRFQNVYGEGQSLRNPYTGIISIFFNRARQGLRIPVYEDGLESRDFVHINDVVAALAASLLTTLPNGIVMNVGSGNKRQLWVPPGFAHGFVVTSESAEFLYKTTDYWYPEHERSLLWCDPTVGVQWPVDGEPMLAAKDAAGKVLAEADCFS